MNSLEFATSMAKIGAGFGIGKVVGHASRAFLPANMSKVSSACVEIGIWAMSGAVAEKAGDYIDHTVADARAIVTGFKNGWNKVKSEVETKEEEVIEA